MSARTTRLAAKRALQSTKTTTKPPSPSPSPAPPPAPAIAPTSASASTLATTGTLPIHLFPDASAFESWLETHHTTTPSGIWLQIAKKTSPTPSITYDAAVDCALCFGWIDGQRKAHDTHYFIQRFTPRRRRGPNGSIWSKRNVEKVGVLIAAGRMRESGMAEVEAARGDGRWERAYKGSREMEVPGDFERALEGNKKARAFWEGLGRTKRYAFLWRLETAKREETRRRRVEEFVKMLGEGRTL